MRSLTFWVYERFQFRTSEGASSDNHIHYNINLGTWNVGGYSRSRNIHKSAMHTLFPLSVFFICLIWFSNASILEFDFFHVHFVPLVTHLLGKFMGSASVLRFRTRDKDIRIPGSFRFGEDIWFTTVLNNWVRCLTFALTLLFYQNDWLDDCWSTRNDWPIDDK